MSFQISCPHCKKSLKVTKPAFGKTVPCPGCKKPINVPFPTTKTPNKSTINSDASWSGDVENPGPGASPLQSSPSTSLIPEGRAIDDPLVFPNTEAASTLPPNHWPPVADSSENQDGTSPPLGQLPPNLSNFPAYGLPKSISVQSAFPKGEPSRFLDFFDFGFKRYLTPWIVRRVWLWGTCLLVLALVIQITVYVHKSLPSREVVNLPIPPDVRMQKEILDEFIQEKETSEVTETHRRELSSTDAHPAPKFNPKSEPETDYFELYPKMTLEQLRAERQSLEKQFPETGKKWTTLSVYYLFATAIVVLGTILVLVFLRVVCELIIVVFNIAISLSEIANNTSELGTPHKSVANQN